MIAIVCFSICYGSPASVMRRPRSVAERDEENQDSTILDNDTYREMTRRIDDILRRHQGEKSLALELTAGPDSTPGARELHRLLPGAAVELAFCPERGVNWVDVYSGGYRIGRFALLEARLLLETVGGNRITGSYVAEQNCYGIDDSYRMGIIVFYAPKVRYETEIADYNRKAFFRNAAKSLNICPN